VRSQASRGPRSGVGAQPARAPASVWSCCASCEPLGVAWRQIAPTLPQSGERVRSNRVRQVRVGVVQRVGRWVFSPRVRSTPPSRFVEPSARRQTASSARQGTRQRRRSRRRSPSRPSLPPRRKGCSPELQRRAPLPAQAQRPVRQKPARRGREPTRVELRRRAAVAPGPEARAQAPAREPSQRPVKAPPRVPAEGKGQPAAEAMRVGRRTCRCHRPGFRDGRTGRCAPGRPTAPHRRPADPP